MSDIFGKDEFIANLKQVGMRRYHDKHPFHQRMHRGQLTAPEIRAWIVNRFYYQACLPIKDSLIVSKLPFRDSRRIWIQRIIDHDGPPIAYSNSLDGAATTAHPTGRGGIDAWIDLGAAAGVDPSQLQSMNSVLPGVRFAVDAYVNFCRLSSWYEAVASSLTELFAPDLVSQRLQVFQTHYPWVATDGLDYFRKRLDQAPRDADHALDLVVTHGVNKEMQDKAIAALEFKCDVLWSILDCIEFACLPQEVKSGV